MNVLTKGGSPNSLKISRNIEKNAINQSIARVRGGGA